MLEIPLCLLGHCPTCCPFLACHGTPANPRGVQSHPAPSSAPMSLPKGHHSGLGTGIHQQLCLNTGRSRQALSEECEPPSETSEKLILLGLECSDALFITELLRLSHLQFAPWQSPTRDPSPSLPKGKGHSPSPVLS